MILFLAALAVIGAAGVVDLVLTMRAVLQEIRTFRARGVTVMIDPTTQASIDRLTASVAKETSVEQSLVTLTAGLSAQLRALAGGVADPAIAAAINGQADAIDANVASLTAAVTANTPAAPTT